MTEQERKTRNEMSLIALTMGREVAFVVCHHILRVLFALFAAPALVSRLSERQG